MRWILAAGACLLSSVALWADDVASGPKSGEKVAALPVYAATGEPKEKDLDYAAHRKEKPTVYVFVNREHWSRPMAQFLRKLDDALPDISDDAQAVVVFLTDKPDNDKDYLPRVNMSLQFKATAMTVFTGEKSGPKDWGINVDAHLTAVVAHQGKVVASTGYMSVNATDVPGVTDSLKKALKK